jgi:hypothetical protein
MFGIITRKAPISRASSLGAKTVKRGVLVIGSLVALIALFAAAVPTQSESVLTQAPRIHEKGATSTSTNWAGYAVETSFGRPQNGSVTDVKGSWVVPGVTATSTNSYSAIWVGIDGFSSNTVEQLGTEQDWVNGQLVYSAWWEMYPGPSFTITGFTIAPGDTINAEVRYIGGGSFTLSMTDVNKSETFSTTQQSRSAKRTSAEWIVEAPWSGGVLPLADFGIATVNGAAATLNGTTGPINGASWRNTSINMVDSSGALKASTGSLSSGGTSFKVTWFSSN